MIVMNYLLAVSVEDYLPCFYRDVSSQRNYFEEDKIDF